MPIVDSSTYQPPRWLPGGHLQTVFPTLFRRVAEPELERVRIETPDNDFLDLDFGRGAPQNGQHGGLLILSHGLEGHSRRKYILGMGRAFMARGWDMLSWNQRSCSEEMNRTPRLYHSGETEDLQCVIRYALGLGHDQVVLAGFSMGGNQILKYLGESADFMPTQVKGAVTFSVPCHLPSCSMELAKPHNRIYMENFMRTLREKMRAKHEAYPQLFDIEGLDKMKDFKAFDDRFTSSIYGFTSAEDYWERASSLPFLPRIKVPVLLVNALNDPFLTPECFPKEIARQSRFLYLETPRYGGHTGFAWQANGQDGHPLKRYCQPASLPEAYWSELRAIEFVEKTIGIPL